MIFEKDFSIYIHINAILAHEIFYSRAIFPIEMQDCFLFVQILLTVSFSRPGNHSIKIRLYVHEYKNTG